LSFAFKFRIVFEYKYNEWALHPSFAMQNRFDVRIGSAWKGTGKCKINAKMFVRDHYLFIVTHSNQMGSFLKIST